MTGNFFFIYICRIVCESGVGYEVWHCSAVDNGKVFYGLRSSVITQIIGECGFVERLACLYFLSKKNVLPLSLFFADAFLAESSNYIIAYKWERKS